MRRVRIRFAPVRYRRASSARVLLPNRSLLLEVPEIQPYLTGYDAELLGTQWRSADPAMDALQRDVAALVEDGGDFAAVCEVIGAPPPRPWTPAGVRPHLTESWFCCAEPTAAQRSKLAQHGVEPAELA